MTATSHAIVGVIIAAKIPDPVIAIPLALGSHIILDLIPHWDAGTHFHKKTGHQLFQEAALDVCIGYITAYTILFLFFPNTNFIYAFWMIFAAQFLDYLPTPYYMFHVKNKLFKFFFDFSDKINSRLDKPWGILTQVVFLASIFIIAKFS